MSASPNGGGSDNGDLSGILGGPVGLSAKSDAAGFSPIRFNKGREHALDVDPRTKLKIINVPAEHRVKFADLQDVVIHVFVMVWKITSTDTYERVFIITDQSVLLCGKDGAVSRCFMVDRISQLIVCNDNRGLAIKVPSECDMLLKFHQTEPRDRAIKVLRTVYRRLARAKLEVERLNIRKFEPEQFQLKKPPNFRLTIIPQLTKEDLRRAVGQFEEGEEQLLDELDQYQEEMEEKHNSDIAETHSMVTESVQKLREAVKEVWDNEAKLTKLREDVLKGRRLIEQVDGPYGPDGELPMSKDSKIAELELIVHRLNAAVFAGTAEQTRRPGMGSMATTSTYFQKDLESELYQPTWPGEGEGLASGDVSSLCRVLQEKVAVTQDDINAAREVLSRGEEVELKIQRTEERVAQLRHLQRTGRFEKSASRAGGLVGTQSSPSSPSKGATTVRQQQAEDDGQYGWLNDLPADLTVDSLQVDPRTGLHFITIPATMQSFFVDAQDAVLHFFAVVKKPSKVGEMVRRVLLISDQAMYLCTSNGAVKRCIDVIDIDEILLDSTVASAIGFRSQNDYDMAFQCASADHRQEIVDILQRLYKFATGGRAIPVSTVPTHKRIEGFLNLQQPEGYVLRMTKFRTRQELVDAIRDRRDMVLRNAPIASSSAGQKPSDVKMPEAEYLQLRADVARQMEYEWRQDATLVQLRNQLDQLNTELRATEEESHSLKTAIDNHRCESGVGMNAGSFPLAPGSGVVPTSGPGTYRPSADGLFFINVDPVQLNCELDITKLTFTRDYLFTGHNNGFVNVWDLQSNRNTLLRTLRDHTGRITDLKASATDLLTCSTDGIIRRWDLANAKCTGVFPAHRGPVNCIDSSNGRMVSGGQDTIIQLWNLERGQAVSALRGHHSAVMDLRFEGDMLVSCEWRWILFWDIRSGKVVRSLRDEFGGLRCLDYSEGVAVAGGSGGDLTIWDISKGSGETINAHTDDVLDVQLCGKSCISSGGDYKIKMWDLAGMRSLGTFHESHPFETKSFRMEGRRLIAAQGQFAKIWTK